MGPAVTYSPPTSTAHFPLYKLVMGTTTFTFSAAEQHTMHLLTHRCLCSQHHRTNTRVYYENGQQRTWVQGLCLALISTALMTSLTQPKYDQSNQGVKCTHKQSDRPQEKCKPYINNYFPVLISWNPWNNTYLYKFIIKIGVINDVCTVQLIILFWIFNL